MTSFRADCDFGSWQLPVANRIGFECHLVVLPSCESSSIFVSVDLLDLLLSPHFQILNGAPYSDWKVIFCIVFNFYVLGCTVVSLLPRLSPGPRTPEKRENHTLG